MLLILLVVLISSGDGCTQILRVGPPISVPRGEVGQQSIWNKVRCYWEHVEEHIGKLS
jgi:hypothetical protein